MPAASLTNTNNLAAGTAFNSITFTGTGYSISTATGSSVTLGNLTVNTPGAGTNTETFWGMDRQQYEAVQPPLYYIAVAPVYWVAHPFGIAAAVFALRTASVLLALLAIRGRPMRRVLVAGTLWPEVTESRAYASLRSALSRLYGIVREAVEVNPSELRLASSVRVDLRESQALAHRLLDAVNQPLEKADLSGAAIAALSGELLPDWYDDWVLLEAEDWRQLRLHALEALAGLLTVAGVGQ